MNRKGVSLKGHFRRWLFSGAFPSLFRTSMFAKARADLAPDRESRLLNRDDSRVWRATFFRVPQQMRSRIGGFKKVALQNLQSETILVGDGASVPVLGFLATTRTMFVIDTKSPQGEKAVCVYIYIYIHINEYNRDIVVVYPAKLLGVRVWGVESVTIAARPATMCSGERSPRPGFSNGHAPTFNPNLEPDKDFRRKRRRAIPTFPSGRSKILLRHFFSSQACLWGLHVDMSPHILGVVLWIL